MVCAVPKPHRKVKLSSHHPSHSWRGVWLLVTADDTFRISCLREIIHKDMESLNLSTNSHTERARVQKELISCNCNQDCKLIKWPPKFSSRSCKFPPISTTIPGWNHLCSIWFTCGLRKLTAALGVSICTPRMHAHWVRRNNVCTSLARGGKRLSTPTENERHWNGRKR